MAFARFLFRVREPTSRAQRDLSRAAKQRLQQSQLFSHLQRLSSPAFVAKATSTATLTWPSFQFPWVMSDSPAPSPSFLNAKDRVAPSEASSWPDFMRWTPSSPQKLLEVEQNLLKGRLPKIMAAMGTPQSSNFPPNHFPP